MADDLASRSLAVVIVEVGSLLLLNALSLIGNVLVCIAVYRNTRLRTTTNLYIIALAVADLLSAVFVMPFSAGVLISGKWMFGRTFCEFHAFLTLFVMYVSPVTMGLTAINRYVRICRTNVQYQTLFSNTRSRVWLFLSWAFVACYLIIPRSTGFQAYGFMPDYAGCSVQHLSDGVRAFHYSFVLSMFLFLPLVTTIFGYAKVARKVRQHNVETGFSCQRNYRQGSSVSAHEIKLSKSLFTVVFVFMVCWISLWVIAIVKRFRLVSNMSRNVKLLSMFFMYITNAVNPLIYAGMNSQFRREFRRALRCESRGNVEDIPLAMMQGSKIITSQETSKVHPETINSDVHEINLRVAQDSLHSLCPAH